MLRRRLARRLAAVQRYQEVIERGDASDPEFGDLVRLEAALRPATTGSEQHRSETREMVMRLAALADLPLSTDAGSRDPLRGTLAVHSAEVGGRVAGQRVYLADVELIDADRALTAARQAVSASRADA